MIRKTSKSLKREPRIKNRIHLCRTAIGLTQKKLAFLLNMSASQVSRWEKGKAKPKVSNAIGLAVATQRLVEDIFYYYREEWQEKIKKRRKLLNSKENNKK